MLAALHRWLTSQFGKEWTNAGRTLKVGKQIDSILCAICMMNAIAHAIFSDKLWTQKRAILARAAWFETLSKAHLNEVSSPSRIAKCVGTHDNMKFVQPS